MKKISPIVLLTNIFIITVCTSVQASNEKGTPPEWIIEKYSLDNSLRNKGVPLKKDKIHAQKIDIDKNGITDWALSHSINCGTGFGCELDMYAYINNKYCYVGIVYMHEMKSSNYLNIQCRQRKYWLKKSK